MYTFLSDLSDLFLSKFIFIFHLQFRYFTFPRSFHVRVSLLFLFLPHPHPTTSFHPQHSSILNILPPPPLHLERDKSGFWILDLYHSPCFVFACVCVCACACAYVRVRVLCFVRVQYQSVVFLCLSLFFLSLFSYFHYPFLSFFLSFSLSLSVFPCVTLLEFLNISYDAIHRKLFGSFMFLSVKSVL